MHSWVERSFALLRTLAVVSFAFSWSCESSSSKSADAGADASDVDSATEEPDHDAGDGDSGDAGAGDGDAGDGDAAVDGGERRRGVYAIKTVVDVWWQDEVDPPLADSGRGRITMFHKVNVAEACGDGALEQVEVEPCGIAFPTFVSWAHCAAYQLEAPASLWSSPPLPAWSTTDALERDGVASVPLELGKIGTTYREGGCGINGSQSLVFRGIPTSGLVNILCDPSGEGTGGCPLAAKLAARVQSSFTFGPSFDACTMSVARTTTALGLASIELDVEACELYADGSPCVDSQTEFVDMFVPSYSLLEAGAAPPPTALANWCECPGGCAGEPCPLDQTPSLGTRSAIVWLDAESADLDCEGIRNAVDAAYPGSSF